MDDIRLDKYLWAVRVFKTRSDAADAIRNNKVTVNGSAAKPSREVKVGDVIAVRKMQVTYSYRVLDLVSSRQPPRMSPVLPQHHPAGGAGQAQHPARNDLRLPRPRYGAPDQKGAPRTGRADGRNLLRRGRVGQYVLRLPIRTPDLRGGVRSSLVLGALRRHEAPNRPVGITPSLRPWHGA